MKEMPVITDIRPHSFLERVKYSQSEDIADSN